MYSTKQGATAADPPVQQLFYQARQTSLLQVTGAKVCCLDPLRMYQRRELGVWDNDVRTGMPYTNSGKGELPCEALHAEWDVQKEAGLAYISAGDV